ncbi:hypothetical protein, partial [Escherichia coli]|uniref:hypothetical protein n=1 Tax=Escherichia coli TaxID=562 RepID=UPI002FBE58E1
PRPRAQLRTRVPRGWRDKDLMGLVATWLIGYEAFQECDMVGISRPVVKHSFLVKQTEDIPQVLKKAFWLAASGRP